MKIWNRPSNACYFSLKNPAPQRRQRGHVRCLFRHTTAWAREPSPATICKLPKIPAPFRMSKDNTPDSNAGNKNAPQPVGNNYKNLQEDASHARPSTTKQTSAVSQPSMPAGASSPARLSPGSPIATKSSTNPSQPFQRPTSPSVAPDRPEDLGNKQVTLCRNLWSTYLVWTSFGQNSDRLQWLA